MFRASLTALAALSVYQSSALAFDCKRYDAIIAPVIADFKGKPGQYTIDAQNLLHPVPAGAQQCVALPSAADRPKASLHCDFHFSNETAARSAFQENIDQVTSCRPDQVRGLINRPLKNGEVALAGGKSASGDKGWLIKLMHVNGQWKVQFMGSAVPEPK